MKKQNLLVCCLALIFSLSVMTSCKKVEGCTDENSPSFNVEAEKDDGSCVSIADALVGSSWNAAETSLGITTTYEVEITKVDDNTITISEKDRFPPVFYSPDTYEVDVNWLNKTVSSTNDVYTGTIASESKLEVSYEVQSTQGANFTVSVEYTK